MSIYWQTQMIGWEILENHNYINNLNYKAKYVKGAMNSKALNIMNKIEVKISAVTKINFAGFLVNITNLYN